MMVVGAAQQPADAVERVLAAAAVPEVLALDPAANLVDRGEPEAHHMKRIQHPHGVRQGGTQRRGVAAIRVQRRGPDRGPPAGVALAHPADQGGCAAVGDHIQQPGRPVAAGQIHDAGHEAGRAGGRGGLERGLVHPEHRHPGEAVRVIHPGVPWARTAAIAVPHPIPNSRATAATDAPSSPTRRHTSARARSVSDARGPITGEVSVQVLVGHN